MKDKFSGMWGGRTIDELVLVFRQEIPLDCDKILFKAKKMEWEIRLELLVENEMLKTDPRVCWQVILQKLVSLPKRNEKEGGFWLSQAV